MCKMRDALFAQSVLQYLAGTSFVPKMYVCQADVCMYRVLDRLPDHSVRKPGDVTMKETDVHTLYHTCLWEEQEREHPCTHG